MSSGSGGNRPVLVLWQPPRIVASCHLDSLHSLEPPGYVSQAWFEQLYKQGLKLIAKRHKNLANQLVSQMDEVLLRKWAIIEPVSDQLKNIGQIEHLRHQSDMDFLANLLGGLIADSCHPRQSRSRLAPEGARSPSASDFLASNSCHTALASGQKVLHLRSFVILQHVALPHPAPFKFGSLHPN
ncbi:MAG: transposase [Leptolyngbyaceae cyanobacterium]